MEIIIYKYLTGEAKPEEESFLLDWIKQSPDNKQLFFDIKALWEIRKSYTTDSTKQETQVNSSLNKLNNRIDGL